MSEWVSLPVKVSAWILKIPDSSLTLGEESFLVICSNERDLNLLFLPKKKSQIINMDNWYKKP